MSMVWLGGGGVGQAREQAAARGAAGRGAAVTAAARTRAPAEVMVPARASQKTSVLRPVTRPRCRVGMTLGRFASTLGLVESPSPALTNARILHGRPPAHN